MTARIVMNAGAGPVVGSITLPGSGVGTAITLSNQDNTGVAGWKWEMIDAPASSVAYNPLPAPSFSATWGVTPDVKGESILVRLTTYKDAARTQVDAIDQKLVRVRFDPPFDWVIPAAGESIEANEIRGWAADVNRTLRDIHDSLGAGASIPLIGNDGDVYTLAVVSDYVVPLAIQEFGGSIYVMSCGFTGSPTLVPGVVQIAPGGSPPTIVQRADLPGTPTEAFITMTATTSKLWLSTIDIAASDLYVRQVIPGSPATFSARQLIYTNATNAYFAAYDSVNDNIWYCLTDNATSNSKLIRVRASDGAVTGDITISTGLGDTLAHMVFDPTGSRYTDGKPKLYVANATDGKIYAITDLEGTPAFFGAATSAGIPSPFQLALDVTGGYLFVANATLGSIGKITLPLGAGATSTGIAQGTLGLVYDSANAVLLRMLVDASTFALSIQKIDTTTLLPTKTRVVTGPIPAPGLPAYAPTIAFGHLWFSDAEFGTLTAPAGAVYQATLDLVQVWSIGASYVASFKPVPASGSTCTANNVTISGQYACAEGDGTTASGHAANAYGTGSIASGDSAHAEGITTTASGTASHTEGNNTQALGYTAHAEGDGTTAAQTSAHAEGQLTTASGTAAHAEGSNTQATGGAAHAEGSATIASGASAHAEGTSTTASATNTHAQGTYAQAFVPGSEAHGVETSALVRGAAQHGRAPLAAAIAATTLGPLKTTGAGIFPLAVNRLVSLHMEFLVLKQGGTTPASRVRIVRDALIAVPASGIPAIISSTVVSTDDPDVTGITTAFSVAATPEAIFEVNNVTADPVRAFCWVEWNEVAA